MQHGIPVLSTQALYPIPRPAWVFRRCDQREIIEEIYQQSIGAEERDSLHQAEPGVQISRTGLPR